MTDTGYALTVEALSCRYATNHGPVLEDIDLTISEGEKVAILGASGAGKTTLLKCINQLVRPQSGRILVGDTEIWSPSARPEPAHQCVIGMIFQEYALVESLSALDNVLIGCLGRVPRLRSIFGIYPEAEREIAWSCLEQVGLEEKGLRRVDGLSGGERQRVAIARVLAQRPRIVLADEPVSNLDPPLRHHAMELLVRICQQEERTLIASLHALDLVGDFATRIVGLRDSRVIFDGDADAATDDVIEMIYGV